MRSEMLRLKAEHDDIASKFLEASNQRIAIHHRAENLESELSQALEHVRLVQDELASCQESQLELDRLRVEAEALRERATLAVRLEEALHALQQADERRQLELDETVLLNARLQERVETLAAEQVRSHRDGLEHLEVEVVSLRTSLDALSTESAEKLGRLTQERDLAVGERDRLERELETLGTGLKTAREEIQGLGKGLAEIAFEGVRLEDEREAVARLRSELQSLIKEREHALEEQIAEVVQTRDRLEAERSALQAQSDREREEGLVELQKLARELASVRGERDELFQTLQSTRWEFESFKNRRLDENEAQAQRERELRSVIDSLRAAERPPIDQGLQAQAAEDEELQALRAELDTRRLDAEENANRHRDAIQTLRQEWLEESHAWRARVEAAEHEVRSIRSDAERLQREADLVKSELGDARDRLDAGQRDRTRLVARIEELEFQAKEAAERARREIEKLTHDLAEAVRGGKSEAVWMASLTQRVDTSAAESREKPAGKGAPIELPPRPQLGPGQDQDAFEAALQEWMSHAQRRRNQATASLVLLDGELQSAREQLLLLHRDVALGDWDDESIAFPFGEE